MWNHPTNEVKKLVAENMKFNSSFLKMSTPLIWRLISLIHHTEMNVHRQKRARTAASQRPNGPFLSITCNQKHCFQKCQSASTEINKEPQLTSLLLWGPPWQRTESHKKKSPFAYMYVCAWCACLMASRGQQMSNPQDWSDRWLRATSWVLWPNPGPSASRKCS